MFSIRQGWDVLHKRSPAELSRFLHAPSLYIHLKSQLSQGAIHMKTTRLKLTTLLSKKMAVFVLLGPTYQEAHSPLTSSWPSVSKDRKKGMLVFPICSRSWRVGNCKAVGFEILAPALLDLLKKEGRSFGVPGQGRFTQRRRHQKLANVPSEAIDSKAVPSYYALHWSISWTGKTSRPTGFLISKYLDVWSLHYQLPYLAWFNSLNRTVKQWRTFGWPYI